MTSLGVVEHVLLCSTTPRRLMALIREPIVCCLTNGICVTDISRQGVISCSKKRLPIPTELSCRLLGIDTF